MYPEPSRQNRHELKSPRKKSKPKLSNFHKKTVRVYGGASPRRNPKITIEESKSTEASKRPRSSESARLSCLGSVYSKQTRQRSECGGVEGQYKVQKFDNKEVKVFIPDDDQKPIIKIEFAKPSSYTVMKKAI